MNINNKLYSTAHLFIKMCRNCIKDICPDRGKTCLEKGSYLMNYAGCSQCQSRDIIVITDHVEDNTDDNETVTYNHTCSGCGHLIASHQYTFTVDDEYQEYAMDCDLCGHGEAMITILPE